MDFGAAFKDMRDVLLLRISGERIRAFGPEHLILGLVCTGVVGMGRWWDDTSAIWQKQTGIGSLVYVFFLGLLIWMLAMPWPKSAAGKPTYLQTVSFITLTAPPGLVYAFPIELFGDPSVSTIYNLSALVIVSAWRVSCFVRYLREGVQLNRYQTFLTAAMLILPILLVAGFFGILSQIANSMGGFRGESAESLGDKLALFAFAVGGIGGVPVLLMFLSELFYRRQRAKREGS